MRNEPKSGIIRAGPIANLPIRAAQYLRMSTDLQQYSIQNQVESIAAYALQRNIAIVRTYKDEGRSGLRLDDRPALTQLLDDVQRGAANFEAILVYDVSRWGRFQDIDESAYYEQHCKRSGIRVIYCAETFENDDSLISALIKSLKRAMAGEYSRELSAKVFLGHCNLVRRGFWQGAPPGYGLRRLLVSANGAPKHLLVRGERKSIQSDRVVLVPGPDDEVQTVRRIFRSFVRERKTYLQISRELNAEGVAYLDDRPWNHAAVRKILTSEKYAGHNVYARVSRKLNGQSIRNEPEAWIRSANAFSPIVDQRLLSEAVRLDRAPRISQMSDGLIVRRLKALLAKEGQLTSKLIDAAPGLPRASLIGKRFGNLHAAYERAGFVLPPLATTTELRRNRANRFAAFVAQVHGELRNAGLSVAHVKWKRYFLVGGELIIAFRVVRCTPDKRCTRPQWILVNEKTARSDYIVALRMDQVGSAPIDYYLLPCIELPAKRIALGGKNWRHLERYRFQSRAALVEAVSARAEAVPAVEPFDS